MGEKGRQLDFKTQNSIMARKICVVLTTRGNYAKLKSTMLAVEKDLFLNLQIVVAGGILLDRYGNYGNLIERDGFRINDSVPFLLNGDSPEVLSISSGLATLELSRSFARLKPDIVFVIADRYEALSIAHASICMNIPIAHLEGGEISGSIDERIRHAITKLSHLHLPANEDAAQRIIRMGEPKDNVVVCGTPSLDLLQDNLRLDITLIQNYLDNRSRGASISISEEYIVVSQHPVFTENESAEEQMLITLESVRKIGLPIIWILPNMDAGESSAAKVLSSDSINKLAIIESLPMEFYANLLSHSCCLVGNSSSGIRECAFLGVPAVNIGSRQNGRQRGGNVIDVPHDTDSITNAVLHQLDHGHYNSDPVYGDGNASKLIVNALKSMSLNLEKRMTY